VKLGTADQNKGLGTGEDDFAVVVDVFKSLDRLVLLGSVGRHWLGSSPSIPLEDVWSLSVGASYRIGERDSAGVTYDYRQRSSPGGAPQREAIAFWARQLDRAWKGQAYLLKGFSDGSPDRGAGLSATYAF